MTAKKTPGPVVYDLRAPLRGGLSYVQLLSGSCTRVYEPYETRFSYTENAYKTAP